MIESVLGLKPEARFLRRFSAEDFSIHGFPSRTARGIFIAIFLPKTGPAHTKVIVFSGLRHIKLGKHRFVSD